MEKKEQVHVCRNGETVLDIVQENDRLRQQISELEAELELQKTGRQFGKIRDGLYFRQFVGDGETDKGTKFELCLINSHVPGVYCNGKTFMLSWEDVLNLAELAGLFSGTSEVTE